MTGIGGEVGERGSPLNKEAHLKTSMNYLMNPLMSPKSRKGPAGEGKEGTGRIRDFFFLTFPSSSSSEESQGEEGEENREELMELANPRLRWKSVPTPLD